MQLISFFFFHVIYIHFQINLKYKMFIFLYKIQFKNIQLLAHDF